MLRHRVGEGDTRVRLSGYGVELQVFVYVCLCASVCVSLCVYVVGVFYCVCNGLYALFHILL